jgi:hypothetical protein
MRKNRLSLVLSIIFAVSVAYPVFSLQDQISPDQLSAMKKLSFLVGEWKGTAWTMSPQGQKETITQTENVRWRLDGTVLMIEGLGIVKDPETGKEKVVHEALGIIDYDLTNKAYRFRTYTSAGRAADTEVELTGDLSFVWRIVTPNGLTIRYTIEINDSGQWFEVGEYSRDGQEWNQFFEMTLDRSK